MRAQIDEIYCWYGDGCVIAKVYYSTGTAKKLSNLYQPFPKSVTKFMESHVEERENSQCWKYIR